MRKELKTYAKEKGVSEEEVLMMCRDRNLISDNCSSLDEVADIDDVTAASKLRLEDSGIKLS